MVIYDSKLEVNKLDSNEIDRLTNTISNTVVKLLGGLAANAYNDAEMLKYTYIDIGEQIRRQFNIKNYYDIPMEKLNLAIAIIENHILPVWLAEKVYKCNSKLS